MTASPPDSLIAVSPNPAIDRVALIPGRPEGVARASDFLETPGGKAVHVAMVCGQLGGDASVLTTAGGSNGALLESLLVEEGIPATMVRAAAATRGTYAIVSEREADLAEIHEPAAALTATDCDRLVAGLERLVTPGKVVAICGSLPPGSPADLHSRLIETARKAGAFTLLDCSTPAALAPALAAGPDLAAPNLAEARHLTGSGESGPATPTELTALLGELLERGAGAAWLTLGSAGSMLAQEGTIHRLEAPVPGPAVNAIGCGDALLGGLTAGLLAGNDLLDSAALGVAAATDKLTRLHPGRVDRDTVEGLRERVTIEAMSPEARS